MSIPKIKSKSGILYVRANLKPFVKDIKRAGSVSGFIREYFEFDEIFAPYFKTSRKIWNGRLIGEKTIGITNSGSLGKRLLKETGAAVSSHPSHSFVGYGKNVLRALERHNYKTSCFEPVNYLANSVDFSMLLIGCCDESPGFSTVHASQFLLGLSQKHLFRFLLKWDILCSGRTISVFPNESPGCSKSFHKFYSFYEKNNNLQRGLILGEKFIFIPSAFNAIKTEIEILAKNPRFVKCDKLICSTCTFRVY